MTLGDLDDRVKESLSALADGEADATGTLASCAAWAKDDRLRADWHAWHLIGDVLRSEDLAADPRGDRRLCEAIRTRLQSEAVVLAPAHAEPAMAIPATSTADGMRRLDSRSGRGRWAAGGAVAAGVILVAGTFALLRPDDIAAPARLASADPAPAPLTSTAEPTTTSAVVAARSPGAETATAPALVADGKWIRDSRLDRYLEAHKQFAGTSALGVPSAFLRGATLDTAAR